jgi:hypothetical protein
VKLISWSILDFIVSNSVYVCLSCHAILNDVVPYTPLDAIKSNMNHEKKKKILLSSNFL